MWKVNIILYYILKVCISYIKYTFCMISNDRKQNILIIIERLINGLKNISKNIFYNKINENEKQQN